MKVQVVYRRLSQQQAKHQLSGYTYELNVEQIDNPQIGDIVMVPPILYNQKPKHATIIHLSSKYDGPTKEIIERITKAEDNNPES